ncbi:MAG: DUF5615 family PIN-like protein [Halosimplex sp.]
MTASFLLDEHVPRVFGSTLRSNGHDVRRADDVFGGATDDESLPRYAGDEERIPVTHDKKDFGGALSERIEHAGIVLYTAPMFLRDDLDGAVRVLGQILTQYSLSELSNELVWLDQWRR